MFRDQPDQTMALLGKGEVAREGEKMRIIGGRLVIVPRAQQPDRKRADAIKVALAFAAIYVVWGSTYLAIRYAIETIPPLVTAGIRHSIAGAIMLAWAYARGFRPTRANWVSGAVVGALFFLI